ncbi:MipA/OmpV family protein [Sphingomonas tabacisoli]|uniref:MipA/OmpV family protein n=1 Tax=Sphingomonas tabacisoli TaxID=2249466 RepID=A0ABW4HZP1_9SPHN
MKLISVAVASLALAAPALAQQADDPLAKRTITIAAGAAYLPTYVGSDDYTVAPAIGARGTIGGYNFQFRGTQGGIDLIRQPDDPHAIDLQLGPVAGFNLTRTRAIKDPQVKALGKLDTAIELGGYVGIGKTGIITSPYDTLSASVSYVHDVNGAHGSYRISPSVTYATPLSRKAYVMISGYTDFIGAKYADYYYSVTPAGALASGLPAYSARKSGMLDYGVISLVNLSLTGDLTGGLSFIAGGGYSRVLGRYARSPIVSIAGDRNQWIGGAGLAYTF